MKANTLHKQYNPNLVKYVQIGKYTQKIWGGIIPSCNYIYCDSSVKISRQINRLE